MNLLNWVKNMFKSNEHVRNNLEYGTTQNMIYKNLLAYYPSRITGYISNISEKMIFSYFLEKGIQPELKLVENNTRTYKMSEDFYMVLFSNEFWSDDFVKPQGEENPIMITKMEIFFKTDDILIKNEFIKDIKEMSLPYKEVTDKMNILYYIPVYDTAGNIHFKPNHKVIKAEFPSPIHYENTEILVGKESLNLSYEELLEWITLSLESGENTIISGPPGTGKSRLALYVCSVFSKRSDYAVIMTTAKSAIDFFTKPDFLTALEQIRKDNILLYIEDGDAFLSEIFVDGKKTPAGSAILSMTSGTTKEMLNVSVMMTSNEDLSAQDEMISERFNVQILVPKLSIEKARELISQLIETNSEKIFDKESFETYVKNKNKISLREIFGFVSSLDKGTLLRRKLAERLKAEKKTSKK